MIHFSDSGAPWEKNHMEALFSGARHKGIYSLALSQNRSRSAFIVEFLMSDDKIPMKFMIDSGKMIFPGLFDSLGSGWLWLFKESATGALKKDCESGEGYKFYSYLDGSISGPVAHTSIHLGGDVSYPQYFISVEQHTKLMRIPIVGLSKSHDEKYPNFMGSLKKQGLINEIAFSLLNNPEDVRRFLPEFDSPELERADHRRSGLESYRGSGGRQN